MQSNLRRRKQARQIISCEEPVPFAFARSPGTVVCPPSFDGFAAIVRSVLRAALESLPVWARSRIEDLRGHSPAGLSGLRETRAMMAVPYSGENEEHERKLEEVWATLTSGAAREEGRFTKAWGRLGFQGKDPATDFRGTGALGLETLHYLSVRHTVAAQVILEHDEHGSFPLALAAISITATVMELLQRHPALTKCVFRDAGECATQHFCQLFSMIFIDFAKHHHEAVRAFVAGGGAVEMAVMQYNTVHKEFVELLDKQARNGVIGSEWEQGGHTRLACQPISHDIERHGHLFRSQSTGCDLLDTALVPARDTGMVRTGSCNDTFHGDLAELFGGSSV